jgi:hypothetical protein
VTVLGDGGATSALRLAAGELSTRVTVIRRAEVDQPLRGTVIWTWPDRVEPPRHLAFVDARVAVIAYGAAARRIAAEIHVRGGRSELVGAHWFVAQARRQRALWEQAT